jgi:hypothetical protein
VGRGFQFFSAAKYVCHREMHQSDMVRLTPKLLVLFSGSDSAV